MHTSHIQMYENAVEYTYYTRGNTIYTFCLAAHSFHSGSVWYRPFWQGFMFSTSDLCAYIILDVFFSSLRTFWPLRPFSPSVFHTHTLIRSSIHPLTWEKSDHTY